jgi:hypothetical protein
VQYPAHDWFVDVDVTVSDFKIEPTIGIGTNPGLVVDIRSLAAKVRKGNKLPTFTFLTLGKVNLFHDFRLPAKDKTPSVYMKSI